MGKPPPRKNTVHDLYHIRISSQCCWYLLPHMASLSAGCHTLGDWASNRGGDQELNRRLSSDCEDAQNAQGSKWVPRLVVYVTSRGIPSNLCSVLTGQFTPLSSRPLISDGFLNQVFTISHSPVSFLPTSVLHVLLSTLRCRRRCQSPCLKFGKPLAGLVGI